MKPIILKKPLAMLRLLSADNEYLKLLDFFYGKKDGYVIHHKEIQEKFYSNKNSSLTSYHIKKMINVELIESIKSKEIYITIGYKITNNGIKFYHMIEKLQTEISKELK